MNVYSAHSSGLSTWFSEGLLKVDSSRSTINRQAPLSRSVEIRLIAGVQIMELDVKVRFLIHPCLILALGFYRVKCIITKVTLGQCYVVFRKNPKINGRKILCNLVINRCFLHSAS